MEREREGSKISLRYILNEIDLHEYIRENMTVNKILIYDINFYI